MISVLIPVFNREKYLAETIQSVLDQTYQDFEIIVIDDGSTDGTAEIAQSFPSVRYVYQPHGGVSIARNRGIWESEGDMIAFLDSDDIFAPSKLEKQTAYLDEHPECAVCYTEITNFTNIPEYDLTERQKIVKNANVKNILPSACIRRSVFATCGVFDVSLFRCEDTEWTHRVLQLQAGSIATLSEVLYFRRIHDSNLTLSQAVSTEMLRQQTVAKGTMHTIMMKAGRKTSVILPAYNAEKYLDEAIQSVYRQNWIGELELIIVDNKSTDHTREIAEKYNCILLNEPQMGAAYARNKGIVAATGDFIALLDTDDCFADGAADILFKPMYGAKKADAVFAQAVDFISPELTDEEKSRLLPRAGSYSGILPGCSLIRRSVFDRVGLFDTSLSSGETIEWMMRLKDQQIPTERVESIVLKRRLHLTNTGRVAAAEERKNYAALLRKRMMKK